MASKRYHAYINSIKTLEDYGWRKVPAGVRGILYVYDYHLNGYVAELGTPWTVTAPDGSRKQFYTRNYGKTTEFYQAMTDYANGVTK